MFFDPRAFNLDLDQKATSLSTFALWWISISRNCYVGYVRVFDWLYVRQ